MPRCLLCDNQGQVIEYFLRWKRVTEAGLKDCYRRLASEMEGLSRIAELDPDFDVDPVIESGARKCPACEQRKARGRSGNSVSPAATPVPARSEDRDWKMAAAGDRE